MKSKEPKKVPNSNLHLLLGRGYRVFLSKADSNGWHTVNAYRYFNTTEETTPILIHGHPFRIHGDSFKSCLEELHDYLSRWRKALGYSPRD